MAMNFANKFFPRGPANDVVRQKARALSAGMAIVREILQLQKFPDGFTTKQMFDIAQARPPPQKFEPMNLKGVDPTKQTLPPRPDHPVRSITFLKRMILPALEGLNVIKTVGQSRTGAHPAPDLSNLRPIKRAQRTALQKEWVWKLVEPEERPEVPPVAKKKEVVGAELGVGADVSHLNPRRQKARVRKVAEEVRKLRGGVRFSEELIRVASIPAE